MIVFGSFAMLLGVGASVSVATAVKENEVVETKADSDVQFYLAITESDRGGYTLKANANVGNNNTWRQYDFTDTGTVLSGSTTKFLWTVTVSTIYGGVDELQIQRYDGSSWVNQKVPYNSWTTSSTFSGKVYDWATSSWVSYATNSGQVKNLSFYIDAANWASGMGNNTPSIHAWSGSKTYDTGGSNITSVSGGGSYSNKKWWGFSLSSVRISSLNFLFHYSNYTKQTANIAYDSSKNAYYLSGTNNAAPESSFSSTGTINKITTYKKLGSNTATKLNDYYVLNGESFELPALPGTETGYDSPSYWSASEGGTDTYTSGWINNITSNKTAYAVFTLKTYTITFNQNDNGASSYTTTATKSHGVAFTIPAPGEEPITSMGASGGRKFLSWNTASDGKGTKYDSGDTYSTNAALYLYMIQDWYTYQYSTNGGTTWNTMIRNETYTPGTYCTEYGIPSDQTFASGTVLTFRRYYGAGDPENVSINDFRGGNYGSSIVYAFTGKIYLQITSLGVHDVWVEGYSQRSVQVIHGGSSTMYHMAVTDTTHFYTDETVTIYAGDVIKGVYNHEDTGIQDVYSLTSIAGDGSFSLSGGDVVCNAPGVFVVTIYGDEVAHVDKVSFAMDTSGSAVLFAQIFNDTISELCDGIVDEGAAVTTLSTPWGTQATYYGALTSAAQTAVKSGSSDSDVVACRNKYDYVCGKYGPNGQKISGITDFMGRNPAKPASAGVVPGAPSANQSPLTLTLWIVLGAGVLGLGAIGTAYFVSKKKKHSAK